MRKTPLLSSWSKRSQGDWADPNCCPSAWNTSFILQGSLPSLPAGLCSNATFSMMPFLIILFETVTTVPTSHFLNPFSYFSLQHTPLHDTLNIFLIDLVWAVLSFKGSILCSLIYHHNPVSQDLEQSPTHTNCSLNISGNKRTAQAYGLVKCLPLELNQLLQGVSLEDNS